jgi:hypothetical protein
MGLNLKKKSICIQISLSKAYTCIILILGMPSSTVQNSDEKTNSMHKGKSNTTIIDSAQNIPVLPEITQLNNQQADTRHQTNSESVQASPEMTCLERTTNQRANILGFNGKYPKNVATFDMLCKTLDIIPNQPMLLSSTLPRFEQVARDAKKNISLTPTLSSSLPLILPAAIPSNQVSNSSLPPPLLNLVQQQFTQCMPFLIRF